MRRIYRNPPIVEAICEIRFIPSQPWDWTIPGLVYDKIQQDFPEKRQQNLVQMELHTEQEEVSQKVKGGVARMQFLREDRTALIQVGPNLLSVNHLKPYPRWENFKLMIANALKVYQQVAKPKAVRRIGLRYINRIEIHEHETVKIEDYLLASPKVPDEIPQTFTNWVQRLEIPFEHANGLLLLQSGSINKNGQQEIAFLLDLDFITLDGESITLDTTMEWIELAHHEVERTFEACITSESRKLFGEVQSDE